MSNDITFDPEQAIADAKAVDGLDDFGDTLHEEPLRRLFWSLDNEADLNAFGRAAMYQRVVDILATRLRVQAWLKRYPEIRDEVIEAPLVIVGLPRTGTTMLHRTIAADRRMYSPLWFETRFPCPDLDWDFTADGDRRITDAKAEVKAMVDANPELMSIHPMDALGPDEDIMLLEQSFYSFNIQSFAYLPSYDEWIEAQDHTPGYEYLKLLLQFLQWQKRRSGQQGQRWALKAPHHLHYMDLVFKVFPDAKVVQSHRDPVDTVPSLASLIYGVWVIYSDSADPKKVGEQWARKFANGMRHTMAVRESLPADAFLDLWFKDTVSQPLVEIEKVYAFLGMDLTPEAREEMAKWQDFNRRELRPPHEYTLEQFGLSEAGLKEQYREYRAAFIDD
ncbi:sulfotransferase family protein [Parahaliea aestuarii]|uniref:Sulfotransferase n=1 Tax=Parahaliea aestuarii TaxID=1852021 RepID=A0A5C9A298_9GAMM|nr:sulfotransferase [Parahaliea aestuarii]TXS94985.1 sulfotransferase [Parahaliea aestuarii]